MNWLHKGILSFVGFAFVASLVFFVKAQGFDEFNNFDYDYNNAYQDVYTDTYESGGHLMGNSSGYYADPGSGSGGVDIGGAQGSGIIKASNSNWVSGNSIGDCLFSSCEEEKMQTCWNGNVISTKNNCPIDYSNGYTLCSDYTLRKEGGCEVIDRTKTPIVNTDNTQQNYDFHICGNGDVVASEDKCIINPNSGGKDTTDVEKPGGTVLINEKSGRTGIVGLYPVVINDWSLYSGWGTSRGTYYNHSTIYNRPIVNTVVDTVVTTVTKYECPDGSLVTDRSTCPAGTCANGAIDYPNCGNFKKCINGATNYPTCTICSASYDMYPPIASGTGTDNAASRCVAKCDVYSERDPVTGSCKLKACTNGALTAPYCRDCPAGLDDMWNGKCTARCPDNQYRTSTGCVEYRCSNGATDYPNCASCPAGKFLQSDGVCRACDTGTSWNGNSCVRNACTNDATNYPECNLCVTGMEYISVQKKCMYPCPSGYTRNSDGIRCDIINTSCNNYALNYPNCDACPTGYDYISSNKSCLQKCPSGYTRNANGNCNIDTMKCWNGQTVTVNQSCPAQYRYCDNGRMIEANASCPTPIYNPPTTIPYIPTPTPYIPTPTYNCNAGYYFNGNSCVQNVGYNPTPITYSPGVTPIINNGNINIKVCADGTRVATSSNCPIASTGAHKVNTTHVSNISNTSAVCNAMANIYAGMPSYGWIEWGTSENNLNKKTPMQYIGRESVVTYAAPLTGLTPNNFYYCRAVLANNNGTYRGETLSIITKGQEIKYATAKVEKVTVKNNVKKVTVTTPTYACKDEYGNKETVKGGEKMLSLSIDKSVLSYSKGDKVSYTVNYKNISKVAVKNIELKISLPKEIINIQSSKGDIKGNDIVLKSNEIGPKSEGVIIINGEVGTLTEGRNVTVAGLLAYDIPSKDNLRDEVSAINVGIVKVGDTAPASAEGKAKVKTKDSFLPNTLIEWSILIIIIFMVIIAFRAWKAKREDGHH